VSARALAPDARLRVVVCGAVFGQVYLEAFTRRAYPLELAGILARGSARSAACARHYGVPLFTDIEQIPDDVQAACVVVRAGILGGKGSELAQALMRRGLHVLQEHPLHPDELAESLRLARAQRVVYKLNSFYVNVAPVRRFIGAARELCRARAPLFVDAACGCQLSYSLLDIIATALGRVRPWSVQVLRHQPGETFVTLEVLLAGVPTTVRIQNQLDPADPDGFSHLLHRLSFGFPQGTLTLVDTHGPLVWIPRPQFPHEVRQEDAAPQFAAAPADTPRLTVIGPSQAPSFDEMFREHWPLGIVRALMELRAAILAREDALRAGHHHHTLCELWRDMLAQTGPPELVHGELVTPLSNERLAALTRAASAFEQMPEAW
jgi:thiazolinyl imide reductase